MTTASGPSTRILAAALFLGVFQGSAPAAWAGVWRFNAAEFPEGFHALVFYEEEQSTPLALACAWRRDGEDAPFSSGDGSLEGLPTTPHGQLALDISTDIAGGDGEAAPTLELMVDEHVFAGIVFEGDLIGGLYHATIPLDGDLTRALRLGARLELRSSLAEAPWSAPLDGARDGVERLLAFCAKRVASGG